MRYDFTVADLVRLIKYKNNLTVFIFLNEDRLPKEKVIALRQEKLRIINQLKTF